MNDHYNRERCECHECTQARYKSSIQGQLDAALLPYRVLKERIEATSDKSITPRPPLPGEIFMSK